MEEESPYTPFTERTWGTRFAGNTLIRRRNGPRWLAGCTARSHAGNRQYLGSRRHRRRTHARLADPWILGVGELGSMGSWGLPLRSALRAMDGANHTYPIVRYRDTIHGPGISLTSAPALCPYIAALFTPSSKRECGIQAMLRAGCIRPLAFAHKLPSILLSPTNHHALHCCTSPRVFLLTTAY